MKGTVKLRNFLVVIVAVVIASVSLTSCDDDGGWCPLPPDGWNTFYDSRLDGYWELVQANSVQIGGTDSNWLFFNGTGRGVYYYYLNGRPYSETLAYWCQRSVNSNSRNQINIQYSQSNPSTMNYWFEGPDTLWLQWRNQSGVQTYIYRAVSQAPWYLGN